MESTPKTSPAQRRAADKWDELNDYKFNRVTVMLPAEVREHVNKAAEELGIKPTRFIRNAVEAQLEWYEKDKRRKKRAKGTPGDK